MNALRNIDSICVTIVTVHYGSKYLLWMKVYELILAQLDRYKICTSIL